MKQILKGLTIAIAGDFGEPRTASKLQQWIERNGGTFETNVKDCTHLVCTPEEYKKKSTKGGYSAGLTTVRANTRQQSRTPCNPAM